MVWYGLVWFGKGGGYLDVLWTLEIDIGDGPLTFILTLNSCQVGGGDFNLSFGPFLSFDLGD